VHRGARPLLLFLVAGSACGPAGPSPRSALLVTLDTTRADALSCYGARAHTTVALDALAREGVLYERAYSPVPITLPAHASLLTGLVPLRHGVRVNGEHALAEEARTLAEAARAAGLATAAFVSADVLAPAFGLAQGFEHYSVVDAPRAARGAGGQERPAAATVDAALAWFAARDPARPYFLWVHLFDAHAPYAPPAELARDFSTPYLAEVAAMDHALARLFAALDGSGAGERPFVLVVGDHGEAFGEHGEDGHGLTCQEATLRVPLLARWPDGRRAGERSQELVGVVDVAPTVAEALGLALGEGLDGRSFFRESLPEGRGLYFESYQAWYTRGWSPIAGWLDAQGKYAHSSAPEFHDWRADPGEARDLVGERDVRPYLSALARVVALPRLTPVEPGEAARSAVAALGYGSAEPGALLFPEPLEPGTRTAVRAGLLER
jgi:arylsulfatase A-like enzyme